MKPDIYNLWLHLKYSRKEYVHFYPQSEDVLCINEDHVYQLILDFLLKTIVNFLHLCSIAHSLQMGPFRSILANFQLLIDEDFLCKI